jgi:two-component system sensor histidine kinase YesM
LQWLRRFSIKKQLIILASSTCIFLFIIFLVYYSQNRDIITKKNTEYTSNTITQLQQNVSDYVDSAGKILTNIAYNPDVQEYLLEKDVSKRYETSKKINSIFSNARLLKDGIVDVVIEGKSGDFYSATGHVDFVSAYKNVFDHLSTPYFTGIKKMQFDSGSNYIIAGISVFSIYDSDKVGNEIGYCFLIIDSEKITPLPQPKFVDEAIKYYLLDRDKNVFSSNDLTAIGNKLDSVPPPSSLPGKAFAQSIKGKRQIIQVDVLPELNGTIISMLPEKVLFSELNQERLKVFVMLALALLVLSVPFTLIINNLTKPVRQIMKFIGGVRMGQSTNLKKEIKLDGYFEMTLLANKLNIMFQEIDTLTKDLIDTNVMLYRAELKKKHSELAFLQSQINPHFLYNTFETIKGMASVKGVPEIKEMAKDLSRIFRYSIQGSDVVNLQEELEMVSAYLRIQKTRFKNRFDITYELSPDALTCKVPRMIMQPIVENAINHGLEPLSEKGRLFISAKLEQSQRLVIVVKDNGIGIDEDTKKRIGLQMSEGMSDFSDHVGIMNVNNRIKLIYGEAYGIKIESYEENGTEITFHLPIRENLYV